jgi:uncharacterized membrane protein YeaQ/YmgE (transglycosylase-associated protein family)
MAPASPLLAVAVLGLAGAYLAHWVGSRVIKALTSVTPSIAQYAVACAGAVICAFIGELAAKVPGLVVGAWVGIIGGFLIGRSWFPDVN